MEAKEKTIPHPPEQLWHQEGAQQLLKAEPRRSPKFDPALATDRPSCHCWKNGTP